MYCSDILTASQIVIKNPVLKEDESIRKIYCSLLRRYFNMTKYSSSKFAAAQMKVYTELLCGSQHRQKLSVGTAADIPLQDEYKYMLFFDLFAVFGYDKTILRSKTMQQTVKSMIRELSIDNGKIYADSIIDAVSGSSMAWDRVMRLCNKPCIADYAGYVKRNIGFIVEKPVSIIVTATMSAGKSTFINALAGKNVTLSQNTACTCRIHNIFSKPFEDGFTYKYDHDIIMNAGKEELLSDNESNRSGIISVSTCYRGGLEGKRIVLKDTPGVNSSENNEHKQITEKIIGAKKYRLVLYLLNATQLGTNDDKFHLEFVRENAGRTPIIFIMNKTDQLESTDGDLATLIEKQRAYLKELGFEEPVICPVSSRTGYLCKKSSAGTELSRMEMLELCCKESRFEEDSLAGYYERTFPDIKIADSGDKTVRTLKNCGLAYIEKIIGRYCR